jgi:hypothetical protein
VTISRVVCGLRFNVKAVRIGVYPISGRPDSHRCQVWIDLSIQDPSVAHFSFERKRRADCRLEPNCGIGKIRFHPDDGDTMIRIEMWAGVLSRKL